MGGGGSSWAIGGPLGGPATRWGCGGRAKGPPGGRSGSSGTAVGDRVKHSSAVWAPGSRGCAEDRRHVNLERSHRVPPLEAHMPHVAAWAAADAGHARACRPDVIQFKLTCCWICSLSHFLCRHAEWCEGLEPQAVPPCDMCCCRRRSAPAAGARSTDEPFNR